MQKKQSIFIICLTILTAIHILLANFYTQIQAYMNSHDHLLTFFMVSNLSRGFFLFLIALGGFTCIRTQRKLLPIYLGFFLINLLLFFIV